MKKYLNYLTSLVGSFFKNQGRIYFYRCPFCEKKTIFLSIGKDNFESRCISCRGTIISLSLINVIYKLKKSISLSSTYELSFHGVVFNFLKNKSTFFYFSEYFPESMGAEKVNGISNQDIQNLKLVSNTFTLITSTEVFEHVPDYIRGFKEVFRVLKKSGYFIFTVPLFKNLKTTQIARLSKKGNIIWLQQEEYHGSRLSGNNSVPVFWHHSKYQILQDLRKIGFNNVFLKSVKWFNHRKQLVVVAIK
jgi:hypothetical protein